MIGRENELAALNHLIRRPSAAARGVLVVGPIGSGVSNMLLCACSLVRDRGGRALHLPANGLTDVLGSTLPEALDRIDRLRPTMLAVDDLHHLDGPAAAVLASVVLNTDVAFVGGLHPGGRTEPLRSLALMSVLHEMPLMPLPPPLVGALCARLLDGRVHSATVNEISRRTAGWPGLVADLVLHARHNGSLRDASSLFRFVADAGVPAGTARRLADFTAGWPQGLRDELTRIAFADGLPGRLADIDRGLGATGMVHEGAGVLRIAAPMVADAIVADAPTSVLARLADELLEMPPPESKARQVRWQLAAGRTPPAAQIADAARWARARGDVWEAGSLLALATQADDATHDTILLRVELAQETGDWPLSETLLGTLLADPTVDPAVQAFAMAELANTMLWDLDEGEQAVAVATGLKELAAGTPWTPTADAVLGSVLLYAGRVGEALPLLEPVLSRGAHPSLISSASTALVVTGHCDRGADAADQAMGLRMEMEEQVGLPSAEVYANAQMMAYSEMGDLDRAMGVATQLTLRNAATGSRHGWLAIARARVLLMRGDLDEARKAADEAALMFADLNRQATLCWAHAAQALVAAYQGRAADATAALQTLDRVGSSSVGFLDADLQRTRAFHAACTGDLVGARVILRDAAEAAERLGNVVLAASAWHDLARLGSPAEAVEPLRRLGERIVSRWNEPRSAHATALVERDPTATLAAAAQFAAMGAKLHALEAAAQALALARAAGNRPAAHKATAAVLAYTEQCPGANTPALRDTGTVQLTPREREVAELVAGGRTSRETAGALGVSVRTVENMLQRVYTKLGIQDRASLIDMLAAP